ncbi:MAG: tRNA lysidine(34) synthetase TilS [Sedimentisphaerales bacterium]|nr:tRNA lysidine(34) synthetase TilS [Sedimentisphaerales bacterium]
MKPLEAKVAAFIHGNGLFAEAGPILLAVSGGADSVTLLGVMETLRSAGALEGELVCVHVNHQLRGAESDDDESFVRERADTLGLPLVSQAVDVRAYAQAHKLSLETAGRRVRLDCFAQIARARGCHWVATGHQKDDNAETVLQRLRRGTGFRGLAAIRPARLFEGDLWLARPLLCCTRTEIVAYLKAGNLRWREDRTNRDSAYTRNYVRHRLLPALQSQGCGSLVEELSELAASARKLHERVAVQTAQAAPRLVTHVSDQVVIDAPALAELPQLVAVELIRLQLSKLDCGERDLTQRHYESILGLARGAAGGKTLTLPGGLSVRAEYNRLILERKRTPVGNESVTLAVPGTAVLAGYGIEAMVLSPSEASALDIGGDKSPLVEYVDLDRVGSPLVVRRRRSGDRFRPLGLTGQKMLGKFLTTAKVPERVRRDLLVFDDGRRIVWVCPVRLSEDVKVTKQTRRVLRLRVAQE